MTTDGLYSRPQTWQMVYGITGAGSGKLGSGNLYKPGTLTGTNPLVVPVRRTASPPTTPTGTTSRRASGRRGGRTSATPLLSKILSTRPGVPRRLLDQLQPAGHELLRSPTTARTPAARGPPAAARRAARRRSAPMVVPCSCATPPGCIRRRFRFLRRIHSRRRSTSRSTSTTRTGRFRTPISTASASSVNSAGRWPLTSAMSAIPTSAAGPPGT